MPVLLLAYGEPAAKDMLRKAIEARYGMRPPALDSLKLDFRGRARVKLGPVMTWVPVDATAYFRFPDAMRWDFTVKPLKLPVQRGIEAFDGETFLRSRGGKSPTVVTEAEHIQSLRRRLWAVASILLTPLSNTFVKVSQTGNYSFEATNTKLDDSANIFLLGNQKIDQVKVNCLNPDTNRMQNYIIALSDELVTINDLLIPKKITTSWDDEVSFEVEPVTAESNPNIPDSVFTLEEVQA